MTAQIHPTAIVEPGAKLGEDVKIGPYSIVGAETVLGDDVELISHAVVTGRTRSARARRCFRSPRSAIGRRTSNTPASRRRSRSATDTTIREHVTINPGTAGGGMITKIGDAA